MMITEIILFIFVNLLLFCNYKKLSKLINLYDYPDKKLKKHKLPTPTIGGLIFLINFFLIMSLGFFDKQILPFDKKRELFSIFFLVSSFFLIGFFDDKYKMSYNSRIILTIIVVLLVCLINEKVIIKNLDLSFYGKKVFLNNLSIFFTVFSILAFVHAMNMFDGINGQTILYFIILNTVLFFISKISFLYLIIFFGFICIFLLNIRGQIFLGDSGVYAISVFYSYLIIYEHNNYNSFKFSDEILVLMIIPGLELLRITIKRLLNGKNAFVGDNDHLHHLLSKRFSQPQINIFMTLFISFPIFSVFYLKFNLLLVIILVIFIYTILNLYLKRKRY